jgi:hypothetical protein
MAHSTDLNNGLGVHLENIGTFCVDVAYLMTQKYNRLKLSIVLNMEFQSTLK